MNLIVLVKATEYDYEEFENIGVFESVDLAKKHISDNFMFPFQDDDGFFAYSKFDGAFIKDGVFRRPIDFLNGGSGITIEEPIRFLFEEFTLITKNQD